MQGRLRTDSDTHPEAQTKKNQPVELASGGRPSPLAKELGVTGESEIITGMRATW